MTNYIFDCNTCSDACCKIDADGEPRKVNKPRHNASTMKEYFAESHLFVGDKSSQKSLQTKGIVLVCDFHYQNHEQFYWKSMTPVCRKQRLENLEEIYFDCDQDPRSCCKGSGKHDESAIKKYIALSNKCVINADVPKVVLVCDDHFYNHIAYGWRRMIPASAKNNSTCNCRECHPKAVK